MNLRTQRRIASQLLKAGENRIWIDPEKIAEAAGAITKDDVRALITKGIIKAKPVKGTSNVRAKVRREQKKKGRQKGAGKRRGTKHARTPKKKSWIKSIRALRKELFMLRETKKVTPSEYAKLYRAAGAGMFRDKANLRLQVSKLKESTESKSGKEEAKSAGKKNE